MIKRWKLSGPQRELLTSVGKQSLFVEYFCRLAQTVRSLTNRGLVRSAPSMMKCPRCKGVGEISAAFVSITDQGRAALAAPVPTLQRKCWKCGKLFVDKGQQDCPHCGVYVRRPRR